MAGIFKAYDIRGIYGKDLTDGIAYRIGRAFATFTGCKKAVVARDIRPHSEPLFAALTQGITEQGADVIDLGYASTPMSYFANGTLGADAGVMITASHNPAEWNGFKLCRAQAVPISGATGILDIEKIVAEGTFAPQASRPGKVTAYDILPQYAKHMAQFAHLKRAVHVAIDFANGMGIWE
ncbi:MAG: phosphomannomutase/phosphoglucomutase, partial [Kiritimatiellae bacterium]|nr:phosphomannomutase/phosphoglucomutase [Kiritimatiellia bacterium]